MTQQRVASVAARGLTKRYGTVRAVEDVSFEARGGEVVGILGPNGAGKTTILRMLAGILTPTSGEAEVAGFDPATDPFHVKDAIGFLSGDTALYERLTPREIMRIFGELHGLDRRDIVRRTDRLTDELRMSEFLDRRCGTLSTGQKQKANLARAFLHDPPVLMLDEPTSSLDVVTGRFVLDAIARAKREGKAILFSTHIMSEAEFLCDRIVLLADGRVMAQGTLAELRATTGAPTLTEAFFRFLDDQPETR